MTRHIRHYTRILSLVIWHVIGNNRTRRVGVDEDAAKMVCVQGHWHEPAGRSQTQQYACTAYVGAKWLSTAFLERRVSE